MNRGFTKGHENQRDKKVPPILIEMDRRGFLTPPEGFSSERHRLTIRTLQIMDEIAKWKSVTQRSLSKKLGIGFGMVNSYLNRLAQQGYIHIIQAERKRLHYLLTPTGIAEKSVLAYRYIERSYQTFAEARARIGDF